MLFSNFLLKKKHAFSQIFFIFLLDTENYKAERA